MRFADIKKGFLYVVQQKTEKPNRGPRPDSVNDAAYLRIAVTPRLSDILKQYRSTRILSKYLVHHLHIRKSTGAIHTAVE